MIRGAAAGHYESSEAENHVRLLVKRLGPETCGCQDEVSLGFVQKVSGHTPHSREQDLNMQAST